MKSPTTNRLAYSNDETTWTDFDTALQYMEQRNMQGLAFALKEDIIFIDLDHVRNPDTGEIENLTAKKILAIFPHTYTEVSASGKGIHIMCLGGLPKNARNRNSKFGLDIEMYEKLRFVCFTGKVYENRTELLDCSTSIAQVSRDYVGHHEERQAKPYLRGTITDNDSELIEKISRSRQATKFSKLYAGAYTCYESHSQADCALVWLLAFWTRDRTQIDRIFRTSGLMRDKWDRRLYNTTYGDDIINSALMQVNSHNALELY